MSERLSVELPEELIEALVARVVQQLQQQPERRFLSKAALAERLGISERAVKGFREKGCPARRVGRVLMFDVRAVEDWIEREGRA
jgi:hypothetical protein